MDQTIIWLNSGPLPLQVITGVITVSQGESGRWQTGGGYDALEGGFENQFTLFGQQHHLVDTWQCAFLHALPTKLTL